MAEVLCIQAIHDVGMKILNEGSSLKIASNPSDGTVMREGKDAEAIIVRLTKVTGELMDGLPKLKIIGRHGIGVDNIDLEAATKRGILVINVPGEMAQAVAEHAISMLLCLQKKLLISDSYIRAGRYKERDSLRGSEMLGKTLGLIGLGRTGKIAARIAGAGFGAKVIGYDPYIPASAQIDGVEIKESFTEVIKEADMVSIHVPLTNETKNLFNKNVFSVMKKTSLLVNVSRGGIINEQDLYEALSTGQIAGAGTDVFMSEPPEDDNPLLKLNNIVLTPHNAGMTEESVVRMSTTLANDVLCALSGEMPLNPVNPQVWIKK